MTQEEKIYGMFGLMQRAGKLISGADAVRSSLESGRARVVVVTNDISSNTLDKILKSASVSSSASPAVLYRFGDSDMLGDRIGKRARTCVAIEDEGFATGLAQMLDGYNEEDEA
ncbi:MAG: ribosomal L7Ae/L30e/S12e/Gadd45 family protein [Saccharofermentans sp.]|nr:ribosomal L7Ae/L30e/S12e/Gadd45 family protein [Saccharofermentans sp.]